MAISALLLLLVGPCAGTPDWSFFAARAGSDAPVPNQGTHFAGVFTDGAVLQRGASPASVYGVSFSATPSAVITVQVDEQGGALLEK